MRHKRRRCKSRKRFVEQGMERGRDESVRAGGGGWINLPHAPEWKTPRWDRPGSQKLPEGCKSIGLFSKKFARDRPVDRTAPPQTSDPPRVPSAPSVRSLPKARRRGRTGMSPRVSIRPKNILPGVDGLRERTWLEERVILPPSFLPRLVTPPSARPRPSTGGYGPQNRRAPRGRGRQPDAPHRASS